MGKGIERFEGQGRGNERTQKKRNRRKSKEGETDWPRNIMTEFNQISGI